MSKKLYNQFNCSSFMLPEHVEALARYEKELEETGRKHVPEFDEQQLAVWECLLQESLQAGKRIRISYMGSGGPVTAAGVVTGVNLHSGRLQLTASKDSCTIDMKKVTGINEE